MNLHNYTSLLHIMQAFFFKLYWNLIQEGCGYPNRNKAWKGVPAQVPLAGQF